MRIVTEGALNTAPKRKAASLSEGRFIVREVLNPYAALRVRRGWKNRA